MVLVLMGKGESLLQLAAHVTDVFYELPKKKAAAYAAAFALAEWTGHSRQAI
jgi:hypothetical protein